jgi:Sulfotransferase family
MAGRQAKVQSLSNDMRWVETVADRTCAGAPPEASLPCGRRWLSASLAERIAALPSPVIVFNKSHSGSRLLAALLRGQGVFMGSELNDSLDALPFVPLVERVVLDHYPDFRGLWRGPEWPADIQRMLAEALDAHLAGHPRGAPWGWKLCETTFILPLLATIFPSGRFIHLIRDGRDVAFADHVAPEQPFWRKIYFATDAVRSWRGMRLDHASYERHRHLFNARHWQESVRLGRAFGAMLGPSYREVRYEHLCADPVAEGRALLAWLGLDVDPAALTALGRRVVRSSIGKHRGRPRAQRRAVQALIEPTLLGPGAFDTARAFVQRLRRGATRRLARGTVV